MSWTVAVQAPGIRGEFLFPDQASAERFAEAKRAESGANRAVAYDDPEPLEPFQACEVAPQRANTCSVDPSYADGISGRQNDAQRIGDVA